MATELGVAYISLLPEMKSFRPAAEKGMDRVGKGVATRFGVGFNGAIGSIVSRSAGIFAAGFASVKVGGFLKDAITQASDLGETTSKVGQIFGPAAKDILKFSKTSATALGQTRQAALDANATFGIFGKAAGLQGKELSGFTTELTTLASDLASFNNTSPEQAIEAIGAALRGESEPIRAYGVLLDDASLRQEALKKGLISTTKDALTPQQKVLAAQSLIMKQTTTAQGDFARTSGGLANQQRILSARFSDFKTTIGAVALPLVTSFFGFLNQKGIPAIQGIATHVQNFANSRGFQNFLAEALTGLKAFGGFVQGTVIPALRDLAGFVSRNRDFFIPFAGAILAVAAGLKVWAIAQGILNAVLAANPIGLVIIAVAALVAGLVYAYKNSETFRKIVDTAFRVVRAAAVFMWDNYLKPMFTAFVEVLKTVWTAAQTFAEITAAAWTAIKEPARIAIKYVVDTFLGMVETVLTGASKAFGWVPQLGDKLKDAAGEFGKFRDSVNAKLSGITDQTINLQIKYSSTGVNLTTPSSVGRRALGGPGGPVRGPGSTTSDTAGLYALSNREWVIRAKATQKYGDHAMAAVNAGRATIIPHGGFATGGRPGLTVKGDFGDTGVFATSVRKSVIAMASAVGKQLAKTFTPAGGPPGGIQNFRGKRLNSRTIQMLLRAEQILGRAFHITQGSYSTSVAASGSTHAGGGAMDVNGPGGWGAATNALRRAGFAAWHRTPSQGPWGHHIHAIAIGDSSASPAAKRQVQSYLRGGDGLGGGMSKGGKIVPKALSFDSGGMLPTGYSVVHNGTGEPEPVGHDFLRKSDLDGMRFVLDAPGVGTLTGHIDARARKVQAATANRLVHEFDVRG